ncbi:hypothetical protein [Flavisolibacter ginsenosidimutans]|uniref:Porin family protein n=1 Tax=Flavisolibacter ginsenosidimutans TaxID=661481 RepID=A0A5B8UIF6_9BACT|nr:hypothetical protein [Flavisolibacter ginsenosidimutans]QEC56454.1 hypothetical protein FSB75_11305 [Flavisolibacter ginsenosidimutans]
MKKAFLLTFIVFCNCLLFAQEENPRQKFFTGGNFGLTLGRYTVINVSPQIGYHFNRFVAAGLGLNLQYASVKEKDWSGNDYSKTSQGITGLSLFGRFYPVQNVFLQVQPEGNYIFGRIKYYQPMVQTFKLDAEIVPAFLIGGGYSMAAGRGYFLTTVLYDVLQRPNSPYGNQPVVNFGYNFSF